MRASSQPVAMQCPRMHELLRQSLGTEQRWLTPQATHSLPPQSMSDSPPSRSSLMQCAA
jgi:hypothetical protein